MAGKQLLKVDVDTLPSNSRKSREHGDKKEKKVERVTKGSVKVRKKSAGKKVLDSFISEDAGNIGSHVWHDVLIPAAKDAIADMVQGGLNMLFWSSSDRGSRRGRNKSSSSKTSYSYSSIRDEPKRQISHTTRSQHALHEVVFEYGEHENPKQTASNVLEHLIDFTVDYGVATVSDFYDLVGVTGEYTDHDYGWTDLGNARVRHVRGGYIIDLPKPKRVMR